MIPAVVALACIGAEFMTYCVCGCGCCLATVEAKVATVFAVVVAVVIGVVVVVASSADCGLVSDDVCVFATFLIEFSGTRFSLWQSIDGNNVVGVVVVVSRCCATDMLVISYWQLIFVRE